jgi:hypothetical protein
MTAPRSAPTLAPENADDIDLSLACPTEWVDRSVIVYSAPPDPVDPTAPRPNIAVRRDLIVDSRTLQVHALREMTALAKALPGFELLETAETQVGGIPALSYRFGWRSPVGPLEQTFTLVETRGAGKRTFTSVLTTARKADAPGARTLFEGVFRNIRLAASPIDAHATPSAPAPLPPLVPMPRAVWR